MRMYSDCPTPSLAMPVRRMRPSPEFESERELKQHYRDVWLRLNPPPARQIFKPLADVVTTIADITVIAPVVVEAPTIDLDLPKFSVRALLRDAVVDDRIPDQASSLFANIEVLKPEIERLAIRAAVELYYGRVQRLAGGRRGHLLRACVAKAFRVDEGGILARDRTMGITRIRQISMTLMLTLLDESLPGVGRMHGFRDHTTALHAKNKMKPLIRDVLEEMYDGQSCPLTVATPVGQETAGGW